ncbi:PmeII family type II restriction endonuclease [Priestia aryabhattai]|uniref:PmeII family type II restriction endonuclease n=1 Tax=Priestia aryabhattai TaxID=412384 RepID=UPI003D29F967
MEEKELLQVLLSNEKVHRYSLLAEYIGTFDNYLSITEEELSDIKWVDKEGQREQMVPPEQIRDIIVNRESYLDGTSKEQWSSKIRNKAEDLRHVKVLTDLTAFFAKRNFTGLAFDIKRAEALNDIKSIDADALKRFSIDKRQEFIEFILQKNDWNLELIKSISNKVHKIVDIIILIGKVNNIDTSAIDTNKIKKEVLKNWFDIEKDPMHLKDIIKGEVSEFGQEKGRNIIERVATLFKLEETHFNIALLFIAEILKMEKDVPKMAQRSLKSGNPFLFRSLFLSFNEAQTFAVGGKLNSSLETKYGTLFEKLMSAFGVCKGIYNGGIDVTIGDESFDIKSGPQAMNSNQVQAFLSKQRLIKQNILPSIKSYRIALGYGLSTQLNSPMLSIKEEIITGRDSWEKITGKRHGPEVAFAIGSYVARMFGNDSIVASMLNAGQNYEISTEDDKEFKKFFKSMFEEIQLTPKQQEEIQQIENLIT